MCIHSSRTLEQAAEACAQAEALLITAGAGMGVDSGLPDFRGRDGFWRAYPPLKALGLDFESIAQPRWFEEDPALAWGFYGHRLELYRQTRPHRGFGILLEFGRKCRHGAFVVTSNVDGQFQRAGFREEQIVEIHGTIHQCQCSQACEPLFPPPRKLHIQVHSLRLLGPPPRCPNCQAIARPNILMFDDGGFRQRRTRGQELRLSAWLARLPSPCRLVVVEVGAGTAIPSIRVRSERLAARPGATLVRINPREFRGPPGVLALPLAALNALEQLQSVLGHSLVRNSQAPTSGQ